MLWLWLSIALAADLEEDRARKSRETLQDGLLLEAASGDLAGAIERYESLARDLPDDDPVRFEALYWLANAQRTRGDIVAARKALGECNRVPNPMQESCQALLELIEIQESSIVAIPMRWDFEGEQPRSGIVHPTSGGNTGSLRFTTDPDGDGALQWSTTVERNKADGVVVGFRVPAPPPSVIRFVMRSTAFDARVQLWVYDINGKGFLVDHKGGQVLVVPASRWAKITVDLEKIDGFAPRQIDRLLLQDVTGYLRSASSTGDNVLWIDDFEVE